MPLAFPSIPDIHDALAALHQALKQTAFIIREDPDQTFPELYNALRDPAADNATLAAALEKARRRYRRPWLRFLNRPGEAPATVAVFGDHAQPVTACAFVGNGDRIVSAGCDKQFRLWRVDSGREEASAPWPYLFDELVLSRDGSQVLFAAGCDLYSWDMQSGSSIRRRLQFTSPIVALDSAGRCLVTQEAEDPLAFTWRDPETGAPLRRLQGDEGGARLDRCAVTPDGRWLVAKFDRTAHPNTLLVWSLEDGARVRIPESVYELAYEPRGFPPQRSAAFSPDGLRLAANARFHSSIWDWRSGAETVRLETDVTYREEAGRIILTDSKTGREWPHKRPVPQPGLFAFSPTGRLVAGGHRNGTITLWNAESGKAMARFAGHTGEILCLAFSADGRRLATGSSDGTVRVWHLAEAAMTVAAPETASRARIRFIAHDLSGKRFVTACDNRRVIVRDAETGTPERLLAGDGDFITCCAISPDGRRIAAGFRPDMYSFAPSTVYLWDSASGQELAKLTGSRPEGCLFDPTGSSLIILGSPCLLLDGRSGAVKQEQANGPQGCTRFAAGGAVLVSIAGGHLRLWHADTLAPIRDIPASFPICKFDVMADGRRAVAFGDRNAGAVLDLETGEVIHSLDSAPGSWCGGDSRCLASPVGDRVFLAASERFWEAGSRIRYRHHGLLYRLGRDGARHALESSWGRRRFGHVGEFSPDAALLVCGREPDAGLQIWHAETGTEVFRLRRHVGGVSACAFNPDGHRLVVGDSNGQILLCALENFPAG
ncbi:MAG TPA: hypothetical protein PK176_11735 [Acidobacteriota bacterium]|nr:hypothetical protein [Acidobacteriota bacterium]HQM63973.1 hypothetical protein [Acidobacteriota bacterium]